MFDIGFIELVIVAIVGLIVIGPEQLPGTIRTASLWLGRLRQSFSDAKQEIEREIGSDEIKSQLHNEAIMKSLENSKQDIKNKLDDIKKSVESPIGDDSQLHKTNISAKSTKIDHPKKTQ